MSRSTGIEFALKWGGTAATKIKDIAAKFLDIIFGDNFVIYIKVLKKIVEYIYSEIYVIGTHPLSISDLTKWPGKQNFLQVFTKVFRESESLTTLGANGDLLADYVLVKLKFQKPECRVMRSIPGPDSI
ncbi:hypothetical protein [Roseibium album]|uniref:hypothetical protein n=1 Tax=Roseibium album TaxID=311410 RepID=UPI00131F1827|nr:hypothetical protein [Roseibium album]